MQLDEAYGKGWSLLMAKQSKTRKVVWGISPTNSVQRYHVVALHEKAVKPKSNLYTDGAAIYKAID